MLLSHLWFADGGLLHKTVKRRDVVDWLFRIGIYRGVKVNCPSGLIECVLIKHGMMGVTYRTSINVDHDLSKWLLDECEGPWSIRMKRPFHLRKSYLAFARTSDAVMFRLLIP